MKFKKLSILFVLMLAINTFFSSFVFAENTNKKSIVALGDSITYGWNLQDRSQAFPYLIGTDEYTVLKNISAPGWKTTDLLAGMSTAENMDAIKNADLITLDIGNNDLLSLPEVKVILDQLKANPPVLPTQDQINAATAALMNAISKLPANLCAVITRVKNVNPDAPIILYNLYNPFGTNAGPLHDLGEKVIPAVNSQVINPLAQTFGAHVANAYSAFDGRQAELILPGDIHPNTTGHQVLAGLANDILKTLAPQDFDITLTPSTTEPAEKVTVTVSTTANEVASMKWLPGEKTTADFEGTGTEIKNNQFEVTENGKYTVYVMDRNEREKVKIIDINNIKQAPAPDFNLDLTASPMEETEGPVTIKVSTTAEEVLEMKWLAGEKTVDDFANDGTNITDNQFDVTENGKYTVYVLDGRGVQKVKVIEITNIKSNSDDPSNGNPGDDGTNNPGDNPGDTGNDNSTDNPGNGGSDNQTDTSGDNGSDHPASDSADKSSKSPASATDNSLPDTATSMYNYAAMGLALLLAGIVAMKVQQVRRKRENI
ncbi:GDSL-type esterase/lipase family protein [Neobacillus cucumis]|nr:GDSL-type esterase/lipase family protein [Neobacillus cucumis]